MRKITIRGKEYLECEEPVVFEYTEKDIVEVDAPTEEDEKERNYIFSLVKYYSEKYFTDDLNSRRVCLQPKYDNDPELASCMSFIQFLIRDDIVYCYVTMRSEISTTHTWDVASLIKYSQWVKNRFGLKGLKIKMTVNSYHTGV